MFRKKKTIEGRPVGHLAGAVAVPTHGGRVAARVRPFAPFLVLVALTGVPAAAQEKSARTPQARATAASAIAPAPTTFVTVPGAQDYLIGADDVLEVTYWRDKDLSAQVVVRPDGGISLPLLNDVQALGLTPVQLGNRIRDLASVYLAEPNVTVVVKQINSRKIFITGEVARPGLYVMSGPTTVLQLIAMAGGLTEYADRENIAIIRGGEAAPTTFIFDYKKASKLKGLGGNILLMPGDTVLVR